MKPKNSEFKPNIVLCVAAHPDDLEFMVSGSVAKWIEGGAEVHYLICTDGGKGSEDRKIASYELTEIRRQEQRDAADILGVKSVQFLDYEDGVTEASAVLKRDIVRVIRQVKPDTVVTLDPMFLYSAARNMINHSDHRNVGLATMDAVYPLARDHLSFPELMAEGLEPHKTRELLLTMVFDNANYYVDISTTYEAKLRAIAAHVSQVDMVAASSWTDDLGREMGQRHGCTHAEPFIRISMSHPLLDS